MSETLQEMLIRHEDLVKHAYQDSKGYWTIGVGRLIDQRRGGGISENEARYMLENDIDVVEKDMDAIFTPDEVEEMGSNRLVALCNMRFQLGVSGFRSFSNMIQAVKEQNWPRAAGEALRSLWARQTPERAQEIVGMIRRG